MISTLNDLKINEKATIYCVDNKSKLYVRLLDLGFTPGSIIECLYVSPFNDPVAYKVKDSVIALRRVDAKNIKVVDIYE